MESLRQRLAQHGLSAHEALFLPHAKLAFGLELNGESEGEIGESRWGGAPDVPADWVWPQNEFGRPMAFLAQINLADLLVDEENPFPPAGWLQFFADYEGDNPPIFLIEAGTDLQRAESFVDEDGFGEMPPHRLKIEARADLPQWATRDYVELMENLSEDEQSAYSGAFNATEGVKGDFAGQLLGHAAGIGYDPREDAVKFRDGDTSQSAELEALRRWQNLATFDSIDSLDFIIGDAGYFGMLILEDDLKSLDFGRVYAHLQSS